MKTVRRMVYADVLFSVGFATLGFLALFSFIDFVDELRWVDASNPQGYQVRHALMFVSTLAACTLYELIPITVLIGSVFVMARLAQSSEFTVLRTSGLGPWRALRMMLGLGLLFTLLTFAVGDFIAPVADHAGQLLRAKYLRQISVGQTGAWLNDFFPGAEFKIDPVAGANLVVLSIRSHSSTDFHRPQNVGYGLTHILPILAACLGADEGQIIMIDNPEAHLHPSGQAKMGQFLARVAASGIQLIVETHSDHILNGIRRAIRDEILAPAKAAIHFFSLEISKEASKPIVVSPTINAKGQLDKWPTGFFDQFDKDMMALINWKNE